MSVMPSDRISGAPAGYAAPRAPLTTGPEEEVSMATPDLIPEQEEWRQVPGWEGLYSVSSNGRVRREGRRVLSTSNPRYPTVRMYRDGVATTLLVHRLVAEAFHGPPPSPSHEVNHLDGCKQNNQAANLEWVTRSENWRHADGLGLMPCPPWQLAPTPPLKRGEANGRSLLTEKQVHYIRLMAGEGMPKTAIARRLGVGYGSVRAVLSGETWGWLRTPPEAPTFAAAVAAALGEEGDDA